MSSIASSSRLPLVIDLTRVRNITLAFDCGPKNTAVACCDSDTFELLIWERLNVTGTRFAWPYLSVTPLQAWLDGLLTRLGTENAFRAVVERQMLTTVGASAMAASNCVIESSLLMFFESKRIPWVSVAPRSVGTYFGLPSGRGNYADRKQAAVATVSALPAELMGIPAHIKASFTTARKQDDLADALLLLLFDLGGQV